VSGRADATIATDHLKKLSHAKYHGINSIDMKNTLTQIRSSESVSSLPGECEAYGFFKQYNDDNAAPMNTRNTRPKNGLR
jgi:hypothetical protein